MKALYFDGSLRLQSDAPLPEPGKNEALIRVLMAGVCGTDLEILKGYKDFTGIPGHEFVGVVERVNGAGSGLVGKRVVGEINCGCGVCEYCAKGMERHCPGRSTLGISGRDGAFAEYLTLPVRNLWGLPDDSADEDMVFAEPLAAAFEVAEQVHVKPTDTILVLGDGRLGLLAAFVLNQYGGNVTLSGRHEAKLAIAAAGNIRTVGAEGRVEERAYDVVIEATGSPNGLETALDLVKPRGTVVLKSTVHDRWEMNLTKAVIDEVTLVGSRCGPFGPAIRALASGRVNVKPLVSAVYPFDEALFAFERAKRKDSLKVLLDFRAGT
ncbi:MAG: alcohol dehydrogenase catalytic domain-containing protein [Syntrophorhabdales bacterium]|jgi:threonine dehydrogenase-like Zn-dependent dehydrogenase